jgi:hypothetical protein
VQAQEMPMKSYPLVPIRISGLIGALVLAGCGTEASGPAATPPGAPAPGSPPGGGSPPSGTPPPGGSMGGPAAPAPGALPCEVERVLQQRCQGCHQRPPQFGAPMPLLTWSDTQAPALGGQLSIRQVMKSKVETGKMPPPSTPTGPLTSEEKATLMGWLESGAPMGNQTACAPRPGAGADPAPAPPAAELPCTPKYQFRASGASATDPFPVPQIKDTYRCFAFQVPFTAGEQAIAWAPIIDDRRVVHHWILYGHRTAARPIGCGDTGRVFLMGWAPGGKNGIMPPDVGLELPDPGTWLSLEVHYNNSANHSDARDRSGVAVCTTDTPRPKEAGVITLGSVGIAIPPGATNHEVVSDVPGPYTQALTEPLHVLWTSPHMHTNGTSFRTDIIRGGQTLPLVEVKTWDFANQQAFARDPETTLIQAGDGLRTTCTYRNPSTALVRFGEKTENEMCFNFVVAYPITRVPNRAWVTR